MVAVSLEHTFFTFSRTRDNSFGSIFFNIKIAYFVANHVQIKSKYA